MIMKLNKLTFKTDLPAINRFNDLIRRKRVKQVSLTRAETSQYWITLDIDENHLTVYSTHFDNEELKKIARQLK